MYLFWQEEISRREKEERERRERADEKFKEWLESIKDKERHKRKSLACSAGKSKIPFRNRIVRSFFSPSRYDLMLSHVKMDLYFILCPWKLILFLVFSWLSKLSSSQFCESYSMEAHSHSPARQNAQEELGTKERARSPEVSLGFGS